MCNVASTPTTIKKTTRHFRKFNVLIVDCGFKKNLIFNVNSQQTASYYNEQLRIYSTSRVIKEGAIISNTVTVKYANPRFEGSSFW
jgi:hypothetical protein